MALRQSLGEAAAAGLLERAVGDALTTGVRTRDIMDEGGRPVGTQAMGEAVLQALERAA
jgi:3-isopropylmalate dehydrogenase